MNKYLKAVRSNLVFFALNTTFFVLIIPIAIKVMGEELYGLWAILNAILLFSGVGISGMGVVVNKFASEAGENAFKPETILAAGFIILLPIAGLTMLGLLVSREWLAARLGIVPGLQQQFSQALIFIAMSFFPQTLVRVLNGYLLSQLKNNLVRTVELSIHVALWIGIVIIAGLTKNLIWMSLWGLFIQTTGLAVIFAIVAAMVNLKWSFEASAIRRMLNFSAFSLIENLAIMLSTQFDRILVGFAIGPSAAGVYTVGTSVGLRLTMITGKVTEVMIPYASLNESSGNLEKLYETFRKLVSYVSISIAALSSFLIIWMPEILSLWISPTYAINNMFVFRVFVLAYSLFTLCHPGRQTLMGMAKVKYVAITYLISSIIMITAVYYLSKWFGLVGAAWANSIMAILILFNIFTYNILYGKNNWVHIISDMFLGICIPTCTFFLVIQMDTPLIKILVNLAILVILFFAFLKKFPETHKVIAKLLNKIFHNRPSYE